MTGFPLQTTTKDVSCLDAEPVKAEPDTSHHIEISQSAIRSDAMSNGRICRRLQESLIHAHKKFSNLSRKR
ncbi:hypothetical protein V6N13_132278 [Hibiscus sabdariffa]|uniref:Uncharacterized protein n=1 Tax=Hibiscus sabdariffa TaxID=183260 RepID=A0ABR2PVC2_9ROSI